MDHSGWWTCICWLERRAWNMVTGSRGMRVCSFRAPGLAHCRPHDTFHISDRRLSDPLLYPDGACITAPANFIYRICLDPDDTHHLLSAAWVARWILDVSGIRQLGCRCIQLPLQR